MFINKTNVFSIFITIIGADQTQAALFIYIFCVFACYGTFYTNILANM